MIFAWKNQAEIPVEKFLCPGRFLRTKLPNNVLNKGAGGTLQSLRLGPSSGCVRNLGIREGAGPKRNCTCRG